MDMKGDCFVFTAVGFSIFGPKRTANKRLVERPDKLLARKIDTSSEIGKTARKTEM